MLEGDQSYDKVPYILVVNEGDKANAWGGWSHKNTY